jgi:hypothetical protein
MSKQKLCIHQFIRPTGPDLKLEGVGNCSKCIPDEKNSDCKQYHPVAVILGDVEE